MTMCGGVGEAKKADQAVQELCNTVKSAAEEKAESSFSVFEAHSYATQVVAGTNYFIKVHVGDDKHVHLRVFKSLPHAGSKVELHSLQQNKAVHDPIVRF